MSFRSEFAARRVGACLYLLAHGASVKVTADVASVGKGTMYKWLHRFVSGVLTHVKPVYMPGTVPSAELLASTKSEFAARRGIQNVAMAVDGSHVPFKPDKFTDRQDYKNYKGFYSTLVLAFVNSFHLFIDADLGYPGRAGDNTVLENSWLMRQIRADREAWLGPDGVILGDCGASDGGGLLMNPYRMII